MNLDQLVKLVDEHVAARTQELFLAEVEKLRSSARTAVMENLDVVIDQRIETQLPALRAQAEQVARGETLARLRGTDPELPAVGSESLSPDALKAILDVAVGPFAMSSGIRKVGRSWACVACSTKYDTRRAASTHANSCNKRRKMAADYLNSNGEQDATNGNGHSKLPVTNVAKRQSRVVQKKSAETTCIHPRCDEPAKGPRNHYLCEKHKTAPLREIRKWQRQDQASP